MGLWGPWASPVSMGDVGLHIFSLKDVVQALSPSSACCPSDGSQAGHFMTSRPLTAANRKCSFVSGQISAARGD